MIRRENHKDESMKYPYVHMNLLQISKYDVAIATTVYPYLFRNVQQIALP
jgi:hypothetical protein